MKTPTRYAPKAHPHFENTAMREDASGPYTLFTDYTALAEENARLREAARLAADYLEGCPVRVTDASEGLCQLRRGHKGNHRYWIYEKKRKGAKP